MNSTFLRALAVILALGALATAWLGYRISSQPAVAPVEVVTPTYPQVIAAQDIPVGKVLTLEDVELISTPQRDSRVYKNVHDVLGKLTVQPIVKGTPLVSRYFPAAGQLAQSLAANERAIAVKVNEVIGVGGFVKPNDRVDVLLYLRADRETNNVSSAQVVLRDVKVLAYGDVLAEDSEGEQLLDELTVPVETASAGAVKKQENKQEKNSRSAILAVPESQVSRLMLAESSGILRLALRGPQALNTAVSEQNQFVRLDEVAQPKTDTGASGQVLKPVDGKSSMPVQKKSSSVLGQSERVIVHRGDQVDVVNVAR